MIRDPASAEIIRTAPGTKVIDLGRKGMGEFGIPRSGPLDGRAFCWVNHILRNAENSAVLEIQQPGLIIKFEAPTLICLAGALVNQKLNGIQKSGNGLLEIPADSQLEIGGFEKGSVLYLGIRHGIQSEVKLGSRSFFEGITAKSQFAAGDKFMYFTNQEIPQFNALAMPVYSTHYLNQNMVNVYPGPEWKLLAKKIQNEFFSQTYQAGPLKNRMGVQINSPFENEFSSIATAPVYPGTIQLTPSGKLMVLLQDAQVTGGYPRILQIDTADLPVIGQMRPGQKFTFKLHPAL